MHDTPDALLEHTAFVRSVARAALRGDDLVEDVVQDTMITALEESHRRRGPLRSWLAGVARHKAHSLIRRRIARRRREEVASRDEATDGVDELVTRAEEGRRLVAAVLRLDELYRKPILLRYYEGLPPREIAKRLTVPVETARTRVKRGIEKLRAELVRAHGEDRGGWRVALLPLLQLPARSPSPAPVLLAGGAMLGKKGVVWIVVLLVLVGGGLWLRPWADDHREPERGPGGDLTTAAPETAEPELHGAVPEGEEPGKGLPAAIDMAKVDRDRDLHGWVVRSDGSPVAGASVTALSYPWRRLGVVTTYDRSLESAEGPSTVSGVDGSFLLHLERGDLVHLRVRASGLATTAWTYLQAGERVKLVLAEPVRLVVLASGPDGEPVKGMSVRFFVNPEREGMWVDQTAATDAMGRAVFADLPGGLKGWLDPHPQREGVGNPGWVVVELPAAGELVHRLDLPAGQTLRGRVLSAGSDEPIEGARVSTKWAFIPAVRTDSEGAYELQGWTERLGKSLHVVAPGFVQGAVEFTSGAVPDIRLRRGRTLKGRVVGAEREPVAGALVSIRRIDRTRVATPSLGSGVTNASGEFELAGVDWPAQALVVRRPGFGRLVQVIAQNMGDTDLGELVLPPPCEVRGTVTDPSGAPLQRTPVTLTPSEDLDDTLREQERWTDDLGRFSFPDLEPAAFILSVGPRFEPILRERVELTAERPTVDLRLTPESARSVVVQAVDTEGKPAAGIYVWANATQPPDRKRGKTDEDGRVTLELFRRPYKLSVLPGIGFGFAMPEPIELDASRTTAVFTLERLVPIHGRLVTPENKPIAWGAILVQGDGDEARYVHTDDEGAFVAYVSAGARVSLVFSGTIQNTMRRIHKFVPLVARADDVAAGTSSVVLRATAPETDRELTIRLLDPEGKPVEGVLLQAQLRVGVNEARQAKTGPDGRAQWSNLPAVPLTPRLFFWPGGATRERPWLGPVFESVTPAGQEITVRFRAGVPVEGTVERENGGPAMGAVVQVVQGENVVRVAVADQDGRFVAVLDPEFNGTVQLRCRATADGGRNTFSAAVEVQPGRGPVTLRLVPKK